MRGQAGDGVFAGLPVFLADARPQGFLGRTFARRHADFGLPDKPENWSDDDAIVALARKLIVALWRYLTTGVVPEGARARTA